MSRKSGQNSLKLRALKRTVLSFYKKEGRHALPWRTTHDPYHIAVSEVMLQQTQVERVIPYFLAFLQRFPTVFDLAKAPLASVLISWQGLGYNRRAKMLWQCAQEVVARHNGIFPVSKNELENLSGIGPYTAGAIRAFAFNEPDVFIETNIRSVLIHELFPRSNNVSDTRLMPLLHELIAMVDSPREWYAALMDYGSYVKKTYPNPSRKSKHHVKQKPFAGSQREMRGAILRTLAKNESLKELEKRSDARFVTALRDLHTEGMIQKRGRDWKLAA